MDENHRSRFEVAMASVMKPRKQTWHSLQEAPRVELGQEPIKIIPLMARFVQASEMEAIPMSNENNHLTATEFAGRVADAFSRVERREARYQEKRRKVYEISKALLPELVRACDNDVALIRDVAIELHDMAQSFAHFMEYPNDGRQP